MEVNAAKVKFFVGSQVSSTKKMEEKKTNSVSCLQRNKRNCGHCRPSNNEKAIKFGMRIFKGMYPLSFKHNVKQQFFTLMLTEWFASPWWHQIFETNGRNIKRRTECFSEEVLHVCEEERSMVHCQFTNVHL